MRGPQEGGVQGSSSRDNIGENRQTQPGVQGGSSNREGGMTGQQKNDDGNNSGKDENENKEGGGQRRSIISSIR